MKRMSMRKAAIIGFAVGLAAAVIPIASAASLGLINTGTLGSGTRVVAACDESIDISWKDGVASPDYAGNATVANSTFEVDSIVIEQVAGACDGANVKIVVADSGGTPLASVNDTINLTANAQTLALGATLDSKDIEQVTLTIFD